MYSKPHFQDLFLRYKIERPNWLPRCELVFLYSPVSQEPDEKCDECDKPEPDKDVGLFVDYVEWQDAERVVLLNSPGRPIFVEYTLGDPRKYVDHRVDPLLLRRVRELQHPKSVVQKFAVEKAVHEVQLGENVDQTKGLAGKVTIRIQVVALQQSIDKLVRIESNGRALTIVSLDNLFIYFFSFFILPTQQFSISRFPFKHQLVIYYLRLLFQITNILLAILLSLKKKKFFLSM